MPTALPHNAGKLLCFHALDDCAPGGRLANSIAARAECAFRVVPNLLATSLCFPAASRHRAARCAGSHPGIFCRSNRKPGLRSRRSDERAVSFVFAWNTQTFRRHTRATVTKRKSAAAARCQCNWMRQQFRKPKRTPRAAKTGARMEVFEREWAASLARQALDRLGTGIRAWRQGRVV